MTTGGDEMGVNDIEISILSFLTLAMHMIHR